MAKANNSESPKKEVRKAVNTDIQLVALVDIKTNIHGVVKAGETFSLPCSDCRKQLITEGKAEKAK